VHEFLVLALGVVDQGHRGLGDARQLGNLAGMVHTQLHHAQLVHGTEAEQGQRHANRVVEVALGRKRRIAGLGLQDAGDHLRHRGLAIAAGDGNQGQAKHAAPAGRQGPQGLGGVRHLDAGQAQRLQATVRDRRGGQALRPHLGQKVMCIHALTLERHKQIARLQAAAVRVHTQQGRGTIAHQPRLRLEGLDPLPCLLQSHHCCIPSRRSKAARALSMSENGCFTPWISW